MISLAPIFDEIEREVAVAVSMFPPFASGHEGYAVLLEEVEELWEIVKRTRDSRDMQIGARLECIQIAAMAIRFILDLMLVGGS